MFSWNSPSLRLQTASSMGQRYDFPMGDSHGPNPSMVLLTQESLAVRNHPRSPWCSHGFPMFSRRFQDPDIANPKIHQSPQAPKNPGTPILRASKSGPGSNSRAALWRRLLQMAKALVVGDHPGGEWWLIMMVFLYFLWWFDGEAKGWTFVHHCTTMFFADRFYDGLMMVDNDS